MGKQEKNTRRKTERRARSYGLRRLLATDAAMLALLAELANVGREHLAGPR